MHDFEQVLRAGQLGQPWALRVLYERYAPQVHGYVRGKGAVAADEVTNDAFAQAFLGLPGFVGDEPAFRSWLFTIAHRRLVDAYRRSSKHPVAMSYDPDADRRQAPSAEASVLEQESTQRVYALLDRLAPDQRDVLLLRLVGDLTIEQISQTLGKQVGAVKALQRRGLAALGKLLELEVVDA